MDENLPAIEDGPPFSMAFVAHLHAGCYPGAVTAPLMREVRRDPDGARMLDALIATQLAIRLAGGQISVNLK